MHKIIKRLAALLLLIILLASLLLVSISARQDAGDTTGKSEPLIKLKIIDGRTKRAIAHADVEINRENSIRCIKAPCPSNEISWKGKTNKGGLVLIPEAAMKWPETNITVTGYRGTYLKENATKSAKGFWSLSLTAERRTP